MNSQILSKEQVLIVGCGDIGARLAQRLPADLYSVTGLRRNPPEDLPFLAYKKCDVTDAAQLAEVIQNNFDVALEVVIVSMTPVERSDVGYQRAYVQTCENLVDALNRHSYRPRLLVFVSSTAVYSQMDGSLVDENSVTEPESFSGKRLLEAEKVIQNSGFSNVIVRLSGIYGPGRNRLIEQVRQQKASASEHFTNRIHADDCAGFIAYLIELNRKAQVIAPVYIATDSAPAPMIEVVGWIAEYLGVSDFLSKDASNERGNKQCSNRLLLNSGFQLQYPTYKEGYSALLEAMK